jgi:hypothetical protein
MSLFRIAAATGLLLVVAPEQTRGVLSDMIAITDGWRQSAPSASVRAASALLPEGVSVAEAASLAARMTGLPADAARGVARLCEERPAECEGVAREVGKRLAARH